MRLLLLLLLPAVVLASIEIKFSGKVYFDSKFISGVISPKGFEKRFLTDDDRTAFEIQDEDLKSAIKTYYGKQPDQIFLTSNTPWGNLYEKLAKDPIKVTIAPAIPINMIEIKNQKVELTHSIYENEHSEAKKIYIQESETTHDVVTSVWNNPKKVAANAVEIDLNFEVEKDVASINHAFSFGLNRKTTAKQVRSQSGSIDLAAGQKVLAQLEVKKGTLKFQIPYKVSLSGDVTVNYNEEYKSSHFHSFDINMLLGNKTLTVYQTLAYDFYYGENLKVIDAKDGYTILKRFAAVGGTSSSKKKRAGAAKHAVETGKRITKKAAVAPFDFSDDDLKSIVEEPLGNQLDEESGESSEHETAD